MSLESGNDPMMHNAKEGGKVAKKSYSWYSRMNTTKKIIMWLIALLVVLAIALGVGLGVGLNKNQDQDNGNEN